MNNLIDILRQPLDHLRDSIMGVYNPLDGGTSDNDISSFEIHGKSNGEILTIGTINGASVYLELPTYGKLMVDHILEHCPFKDIDHYMLCLLQHTWVIIITSPGTTIGDDTHMVKVFEVEARCNEFDYCSYFGKVSNHVHFTPIVKEDVCTIPE